MSKSSTITFRASSIAGVSTEMAGRPTVRGETMVVERIR